MKKITPGFSHGFLHGMNRAPVSVSRALLGLACAGLLALAPATYSEQQRPDSRSGVGVTAIRADLCPEPQALGSLPVPSVNPPNWNPNKPDLMVLHVGLTPGGCPKYGVRNRGNVSTGPFVVDVYIDGVRKDTVKHNPLPSATNFTAKSELARIKGCKPGTVKVVLDPQSVVGEFDEGNNVASAQLTPPCPDLVAKISMDRMNNNLQYKAKITVTNQGNLATPTKFIVNLGGGPTLVGPLPIQQHQEVGPLAPGQSFTFHEIGKHTAATRMWYRVLVDFSQHIEESNETNNEARATMGGL